MNALKRACLLAITAMALGVLSAACAGGKPIDVDQGDDDDDGGSTLTTNLSALITGPWTTETCNSAPGCHQGPTPTGVVTLGGGGVTPSQVHASLHSRPGVINTTNAGASLLLTEPAGATPGGAHTGGTLWTTADDSYQGTLRWIQQGAQNN